MKGTLNFINRDFIKLPARKQAEIYKEHGVAVHPLGPDKKPIRGERWLTTPRSKLSWDDAKGMALQTGPNHGCPQIGTKCVKEIPCGSGITVIDCDLLKDDDPEHYVSGVDVLMKHMKKAGYKKLTDLDTIVVRTPSGGCHLWVKYDRRLRNGVCVYRDEKEKRKVKIDVKGNHMRVNIPFQDSGYKFINSPKLTPLGNLESMLPSLWQCLQGTIPEPHQKRRRNKNYDQFVLPEQVEDLLKLITEDFLGSSHTAYDRWFAVGQALKYCIEDDAEGFRLWDEWSQNGKYDEKAVEEYWGKMNPDIAAGGKPPITYGSLEYFAREEDPEGYRKFKDQWFPHLRKNRVTKKRLVRKIV